MGIPLFPDDRNKALMPSLEFEGPMGYFWGTEDVPFEVLVDSICKCLHELSRRGYKEEVVVEMVKGRMDAVAAVIAKEKAEIESSVKAIATEVKKD
jgi:hypothetical protein